MTSTEQLLPNVTDSQSNTLDTQCDSQNDVQYQVSFDDISISVLPFSEMFKCAKSASGQVIQGLKHLSQHISGEGDYSENKKEIFNDYQKELYPNMARLALKVVTSYHDKFVADVNDPLMKQVFGANLNGNKNNGQLNKFISCKGVNRFLSYKFAQFGQLLTLLGYRMVFIANRDPQYVKRYRENEEELKHFETLRTRAKEFSVFLKDNVFEEWSKCVADARSKANVQTNTVIPVKLTADNVARREMDYRRSRYHAGNDEDYEYGGRVARYGGRVARYGEQSNGQYGNRGYNNGSSNQYYNQNDYTEEVPSRRIYSGPRAHVNFGYRGRSN